QKSTTVPCATSYPMEARTRGGGACSGDCCAHAVPFHVHVCPEAVKSTSLEVAWSYAIAPRVLADGPAVATSVQVEEAADAECMPASGAASRTSAPTRGTARRLITTASPTTRSTAARRRCR